MLEEYEIVESAINGDDAAFFKLMQMYKIDLYKVALSYLRNENDALEAIQEVTYRAYDEMPIPEEGIDESILAGFHQAKQDKLSNLR